jgi:hypothetical protein
MGMRSLKFKYTLFLILKYIVLYSQIPGPTTNWYFGNGAGITFNSGIPIALTNGALSTIEGVATISDNLGGILFYTNGVTVYNRNHTIMVNGNGLFGDVSSTQSAIIVKQPGNNNIYYIFTSDNDTEVNGICYTIVDMNLDGGLGAVTIKNIQLHTPSCEKLCVVRHCDGERIWVISHDWNSNVFRAWLIDGINPVGSLTSWSIAGPVIGGIVQSSYGQLKASSNGKKLAACYYGLTTGGTNLLQIYDFNTSTGFVTNAQTLATDQGLYGVEFSPNNKVLYASTNGGLLLQYDICAPNIQNTRYVVFNGGPFIGSLQLGPDGKIYVSRNTTSLSVINNPNVLGIGCNYTNLNISLDGRNSRFGLPNFASYYAPPSFIFPDPIIDCNTVSFTSPTQFGECILPIYNIIWDFGDGTTSNVQNPTHVYLSPGTYTITLSLTGVCPNINLTKIINILNNGTNIQIYTN